MAHGFIMEGIEDLDEFYTDDSSLSENPLFLNDDTCNFGPPEDLQHKLQKEFDILDHYIYNLSKRLIDEKKRLDWQQVIELLEEYKAVKDELEKLKAKSGLSAALDKEAAELLRQMCQMLLTSCALLLRCGLAGKVTHTKNRLQHLLKTATDAAKLAEDKLDQCSASISESCRDQDRRSRSERRMALMLCVITTVNSGVSNYRLMRKLFQQYDFDYTIKINPTTQEMEDEVQTYRDRINRCKGDIACCFVVSAGHGVSGALCGCDNKKMKVDKIILPFGDEKCPKLREKPKIFIMDACRGKRYDVGVGLNDPACSNEMAEETEELEDYIQPTVNEMFSVYASQPEFVTFMKKGGSELIRNTAEVFSAASGSEHIYDLFVKVNNKIAQETYRQRNSTYKVMPQIDSTLTELFYLSPKH